MRALHSQGAQSPLRLLLNQSQSATLTRNLQYHRYLLEAQQAQVAHYTRAIQQHQRLEDELTATIGKLQQLQVDADREQQALAAKREERQSLLLKTSQTLKDKESDLERQQQDRKALQTLIARIEKQRQLDLAREAERQRQAEIAARRAAEAKARAEQEAAARAKAEAERQAAEQAAQTPPPEVGSHIEPAGPIVADTPAKPKAAPVAKAQTSTETEAPTETAAPVPDADVATKPAKREQTPAYSSRDLAKLKGMSFAASRGQLLRPTQGRIISRYGQPRQGEIKWDGMRIAASAGSPVYAVHGGRVMYADWLRGQGMLMVIDHGNGYMTLYAHNDSLLKQPGDFVEAGDAIARVGNSGGEQESALYFEIRHNGAAINPEPWLGR